MQSLKACTGAHFEVAHQNATSAEETLQARLKNTKDNLEKMMHTVPCLLVRWDDTMVTDKLLMFGERQQRCTTQEHRPHSEACWWEYYAVGMEILSLWRESWRKTDMLRFWKKSSQHQNFTSLLLLPTGLRPKTHVAPGEGFSPEDQSEHYWLA